jgi:hypothetical protein
LTTCEAEAHNCCRLDENGIACKSLAAKNGQELSISYIWQLALFTSRQGYKVFPLVQRDKKPFFKGWQNLATDNESTIFEWARLYPNNNYGILAGNGWFVLDFDLDESDVIDEEIQRVWDKLGSFELGTLVKTGRGYQLYCNCDGFDIRNSPKRLTDKVDIKGSGGFVVGPGSIHPNGARYEFCDVYTLRDGIKLTKLSEAALGYIMSLQGSQGTADSDNDGNFRSANSPETRIRESVLDYAKPIPVGERNDTLFKIGCHYREVNGLQTNDIYIILKEINSNECGAPLSDSELRVIAESSCRYPAGTPRPAVEPFSDIECSEEVQGLFQDNKLIELFRRNVQKFHVGDEAVTELLMLSVASMSIINTNGLQPKLSGESGMGKTHSTKTVLHLMHPTIYRSASFSSKALFYDDTLRPKMVIFSDDVNLAPDVEETVRAAMTNWDSATQHITLDGKRNPLTLSLPPRVAFWLTSVSTKSTIQLLNRQVEMNVDESPDQDKRVEQHQRKLAESGLSDFYVDDEVELLRAAFLQLNQISHAVTIPFIDNIKFTNVRNRRNFPIFLDFIKAYCVLNYSARCVDKDRALIAIKQDFDNAIGLFKTVAIQQVTKLNAKERLVASVIRDNSPCDIPTIMDETRLSNSYIYELIHGQYKSDNRGMLEKIPELKFYSKSDVDPKTGDRWGRNHYALPAEWTLVKSYESIVYWEEDQQLRPVSDSFGDEFRNSSEGKEAFDDDLDPGLEGDSSTNTSSFGTSIERETQPPANGFPLPATSDRNTEAGSNTQTDTSFEGSKSEINAQTSTFSTSEHNSEVARNATEANGAGQEIAADNELDYAIERAVTAIDITYRGQYISPDTLADYVANEVRRMDSSYDRVIIKMGLLKVAKRDAAVRRTVNLLTKGDFPV